MILVIDNDARDRIAKTIDFAKRNPFSVERIQKIIARKEKMAGDIPEFVCHLERGIRCCFTIEQHPNKIDPNKSESVRHLSVSVAGSGNYPSIECVNILMKEFGFQSTIEDHPDELVVYLEEAVEAVNVIELLNLKKG